MSIVRRRVLRPPRPAAAADEQHLARLQRKLHQLDQERASLNRWMANLKRAFHAVEKTRRRIASLERQLSHLQQS